MKRQENKHICFVANQGQHYRYPIFQKIGEEFSCDFYLGDRLKTPIKPFDYLQLTGYQKTLKNYFFGNFYWQSGVVPLLWKNYSSYIFTGEPFCLSTWVFMILALFTKKQTITWTHGWYGREGFIKTWVKKIYFSLFSDILVYGEYAINLMKEQGIDTKKMRCIANSLDSKRNLEIRKGLRASNIYSDYFGNHYPVVIYCGRIQRIKKLNMLISAIRMLKDSSHPTNLVIVGKDVDGIGLEELANEEGVKNMVWFYGPCYDDQKLGELFYNANVCASPGNIGLTAIHALSFGCPAITHDNFAHQMPEFEAIIPGKTGEYFKEDNINDLCDKLRTWTSLDNEQRECVRAAAFAEIDRKWNVNYQIDVIKQILK